MPPESEAPNKKAVDGVIATHRQRFKACYDRELAVDPHAAGTIKVQVRVADAAITAQVSCSDLPDPLSTCIVDALTAMPFVEALDGQSQTFTVPVVFSVRKKTK